MNVYDASEQAYKRGYEAGQRDARKKGRWIYRKETKWILWDTSHYECSNCGNGNPWHNFNYCPNCGADMRGEEDG